MSAPKLKPCPFCGGDRVRVVTSATSKFAFIHCDVCQSQGPFMKTPDAIAAWNRRTP
jgi:Lar family restriction alleviation protein